MKYSCAPCRPRVPLDSFYPQTFRIDLASECDNFIHAAKQDGKFSHNQ